MRINRLTIAGFGPYKTAQHIDFDAFSDDGIFLITGNTGAGKSSILDAICFALYAGVPRYEGTQQQLRSDYCEPGDPTYVELWFSTGGEQYRVRRSPDYERAKKNGVGTTKSPAAAQLFVRVGDASGALVPAPSGDEGEWQGVAAIPREVGIALDGILGLSKDQFLQVILLAQNRFQKFLHAKNDERQSVLQSLFGTRRFADIERALVERRKALEVRQRESAERIAELGSQVAAIVAVGAAEGEGAADDGVETGDSAMPESPAQPESSAAGRSVDRAYFELALADLDRQLEAARQRVAAADARFSAAEAELRERENVRRLQTRRDEASAQLAELVRLDESVGDDRRRLDAATRAEIVWAHVAAEQAARSALDRAAVAEKAARVAYAEAVTLSGLGEASSVPVPSVQLAASSDPAAAPDAAPAPHPVPTPDSLATDADELSRVMGGLDVVLADEKRVPRLAARVAEYDATEKAQQADVDEAIERAKTLPGLIDEVVEQRNARLVEASGRSDDEERVARLVAARESAVLAAALKLDLDAARAVEKAASTANRAAAGRYDDLLTRRLEGHAAELASKLVDGQPCAVCGATDHPDPTAWTSELGEPISDAEIDEQRTLLVTAGDALAEAGVTVQDLAARHASATSASDGRSPAEIDADLASARTALASAVDADGAAHALESRIAELRAELELITATVDELTSALHSTQNSRAALVNQLESITELVEQHRGDHSSVAERVLDLQHLLTVTREFEAALLAHDDKKLALERARQTLGEHLDVQRFSDSTEVTEARLTAPQRGDLSGRISAHEVARATAAAILAEPDLQGLPEASIEIESAAEARSAAGADRDEARVAAGSVADRLGRLRALVGDALERLDASETLLAEYEIMRSLANSVEGAEPNTMRMRLESYVLAAQLEEIIRAANARLAVMTGGRYSLEHDDSVQYRNTRSGLGIAILDQHTGRARATHSLSGGETFLASLALALGLAEVVSNQAGGITLDTLFIDEGFGSLDSDTLAIAMSTLDSLRSGGRTIGLISHVEAMKEQIPSRLRITVVPQGYSEIDQRA
ncbi:SMC family ATPase [Agreia sp. PsM10]|uniref:AAA family ATPase n=1 Tax=Agreia sp. PsM10 TaxID=3030533 RepID=UPI00263B7869|nr:SMC family ATPase [Agreia sp. PsM10]MDN4640919.1 SMC family ATPase [Agreia sp. PsM10]